MTDRFINDIVRTSVAALCQSLGWNSAQTITIDILADVWKRHVLQMAKSIHRYAEHDGRTQPNFDDAALVFRDMNISIPELEEYLQNFEPVRLPYNVPDFPVKKESHLNFLRPGSSEVLTRPVHIHEYMPPWDDKKEKDVAGTESNGVGEELETGVQIPPKPDGDSSVEIETKEVEGDGTVPIEPMEVEVNEVEVQSLGKDEAAPSPGPSSSGLPYSPFSGTSKSTKRSDIPGENPALKRVRMELEEDGYPLREISSVMMTTSGFLSSNREGRLPESRPPVNRDFFDPEPVVEKKKKIPTMKKIVEGIKKLDKEKENQTNNEGEDGMELFGKPDKITVTESKTMDSIAKKYKDRSKLSFKVSTKNKGRKDYKFGVVDGGSKSEKLMIFKNKTLKGYEKYRKESRKKARAQAVEEDGLDKISSEEDFNEPSSSKAKESGPLSSSDKKERKKSKNRDLLLLTKSERKEKSTTPKSDAIVSPESRKKRGRPRRPEDSGPALFSDPFNSPVVKMPKLSKKLRQMDEMNKLVPEICLNISKPLPPPPDLKALMSRLPMQPGLIPTNFGPPPPLKYGGTGLPPSISITPASSSSSHSAKEMSGSSGSSLPLPSNVCSSVTITRIEMSGSQKLPSQYDTASNLGIGSQMNAQLTVSGRQSPLSVILPIQPDVSSGITITPILMTGDQPVKTGSGLARLEEDMRTKEQKRKDKEKRKELKRERKEKKKEKEKLKEKVKLETFEKVEKKERKEEKDKKKKKEEPSKPVEGIIPKLTLKLHSNASTPLHSPKLSTSNEKATTSAVAPPPRKITIKPIESPVSPELARFSPLVTRPSKSIKVSPPKPSPPAPPAGDKGSAEGGKRGRPPPRGRGRPPKPPSSSSSSQAALVTETVGFYIDEHGTKVWICPCCSRQDDGSPMIGCDVCDDWYHFTCVGIEETPDENTSWFCQRCIKKKKSADTKPSFDNKKKIPKLPK